MVRKTPIQKLMEKIAPIIEHYVSHEKWDDITSQVMDAVDIEKDTLVSFYHEGFHSGNSFANGSKNYVTGRQYYESQFNQKA
jgi:regulator of replication initiation timing